MRTILLATAERRARQPFMLKDRTGRLKFGMMTFNQSKGRHELELTEEAFLKINKEIAFLSRIVGCAIFVAEIREPQAVPANVEPMPTELSPQEQQRVMAQSVQQITEAQSVAPHGTFEAVPAGERWQKLASLARAENLDPDSFRGEAQASARLTEAINAAREAKAKVA